MTISEFDKLAIGDLVIVPHDHFKSFKSYPVQKKRTSGFNPEVGLHCENTVGNDDMHWEQYTNCHIVAPITPEELSKAISIPDHSELEKFLGM